MTLKDPNPHFSVQNTYTDFIPEVEIINHIILVHHYNKHDPNDKESSQLNKFCCILSQKWTFNLKMFQTPNEQTS